MEFHKYPKILVLGKQENKGIFMIDGEAEIIVQEKLDGAQFRFMIVQKVPIFGTRNQQITNDIGDDLDIPTNFRCCVKYVREILQDKNLSGYDKKYILLW